MDTKYDKPRDVLVPLAVAPTTRELVRQLKRITDARNIDIFLAPLLESAIEGHGETPVTRVVKTKSKKAKVR